MKKNFFAPLLAIVLGFTAVTVNSQAAHKDPMVGGSAMYPSKNIVQNAMESKDHTTLVEAVRAGGLVDTLEGPGPFTVFAPTNEAFDKLPAGAVDNLLKPENKDALDKVLTYHVVPGQVSSKVLMKMIKTGGGKATLKTVRAEDLTISVINGKIVLTDAKGGASTVTIADVFQSNGVIHVVDAVLMP
jgi:uncharacterized surface protein with fasciclin (FAS1) repeats